MTSIDSMTVFNTQEVDVKKQPMFFGQPLGVQRYDSYKYPAFENLTKSQLGYFWRPEEVSLQKDRGDYQNTNDMKTDEVQEDKPNLENLLEELSTADEEECESCAI